MKKAAETAPPEYFQVDPSTAATVRGRVSFHGAPPAAATISMDADAGCQAANAGHTVTDPSVLVGKDGGVANVFVYIRSGLEGKRFNPPETPVVLDQKGCMFMPRVLGIQAGQPLDLKNADGVSHNIHPLASNNFEWNQEQPPHAAEAEHKFARTEVMIPVKCNIHAWMRAYIGVLEHPYFAVTARDGTFEIPNLPPGDYVLAVWHEKFGAHEQPIHVAPAGSAAVDFIYP